MTTIVWFRQDLRVADHPALVAAAARGPVLPLFILDDVSRPTRWRIGGAGRWWLHHSLAALRSDLPNLVLLQGDPGDVIATLAKRANAGAVYWTRAHEPWAVEQEQRLATQLEAHGVEARSFGGSLLNEPDDIVSGKGQPYTVFSAYWRAARQRVVQDPLAAPTLSLLQTSGLGDRLDDWNLRPTRPNWASGWEKVWQPGERGAKERLDAFVTGAIDGYADLRNRPDREHTSRLSPHLHWGEISPRQIVARIARAGLPSSPDVDKFLSELGWREFSSHVLHHHPDFADQHWRKGFDAYPYRADPAALRAWRQGRTGYPFVDAGMRQLWQTGWMHNRARMVVASFLVKHLRIDWRVGEAWFWDTLVDADLANNATGWQWITGSGTDAAPYFRILNPVTQGQKFDPAGAYIRRWCPELAQLPDSDIHAPFDAPPAVLLAASIELGVTYPRPIVDHKPARDAALAGFDAVKRANAQQT